MATVFKAGRVPGRMSEFAIEDGKTVAEALAVAELAVSEGESVSLDGETLCATAFGSTTIEDGSVLLIAKQVKGN